MIKAKLKANPAKKNSFILEMTTLILPNSPWRLSSNPRIWRPPTDVYDNGEYFLVRVEVAGMSSSDLLISLDQNNLIIQGIRPDISEKKTYYQMEINFGEFLTDVELPAPIEVDKTEAEYSDGFLTITLPKIKPSHIKVNG
jgi:HSP20 family protein